MSTGTEHGTFQNSDLWQLKNTTNQPWEKGIVPEIFPKMIFLKAYSIYKAQKYELFSFHILCQKLKVNKDLY